MNRSWIGAAGLAAVALGVAACGSSSSSSAASGTASGTASSAGAATSAAAGASGSSPASSSGSQLKTTTISGATVLTNSGGFTLYWFVPDTPTSSKCYGSCATYWPPVKGPVTAGSGVTGTLSTISRTDGTMQATWNGHPLYTYAADTAPGQANGNNVNASGGVWHEVTLTGG